MAGLKGLPMGSTYKSILRVDDNSNGVDSSLEVVTDGAGNSSAIKLGNNSFSVLPGTDGEAMLVQDSSGATVFSVDSSSKLTRVGASRDYANTQYTSFHMNSAWWASAVANTHHPLSFNANMSAGAMPSFGTSTNPATTFTTADGSNTLAADIVPTIWYIQDNITIDAVSLIQGADTATGDTTRAHLYSYTYNSGASNTLTSGSVIAYSADQVDAGSEQTYRNTMTVSSGDVDAGKVILAFFRSDSINSDYSVTMYIKYHIR